MDKKEPKEIEKYHSYYIEQIVENNFIHVMIAFHKSNLYIESNGEKIRINYSDIIWCEEQDVLALGRTKIVICTKTNEIFEFLVSKDVKFIEFIQSNIHPAKERPAIVSVDM